MLDYIINNVGPNPGHINTIGDVLGIAINVAMGVGFSVSVIFVAMAGLRYLSSGSNPDNLDRAKRALTWAIVAMVLSLGAVAVKIIIVNGLMGASSPELTDPIPNF